ncbi:MAG: glycosyltransferase [Candidatus Saccharimonadales bacterium]
MERLAIFGCVGSFCLLLQIAILKLLKFHDVSPAAADALGFIASAQVNFWLSYKLTWADTARYRGQLLFKKWLQFLGVISLGTVANVLVYSAVQPLSDDYIAVVAAVLVSAVLTFVLNHLMTFRFFMPARVALQQLAGVDSIAWFMPAHNEAENLRQFVPEIVAYLERLRCRFSIIIVNDGSSDDTKSVCKELCSSYPQVQVENHVLNLGYGAALRTGLKASLKTGHSLIGFCDSDCQFRIESLEPMLHEIEAAHAVFGYRLKRADGLKRRLMGLGWHYMSLVILGFSARDVDCGFKLFRRELVEALLPRLRGDYATISPEMMAWAQRLNYVIAEVGVEHHPRQAGEQSGDSLKVIIGSIFGLFRVYYRVHVQSEA